MKSFASQAGHHSGFCLLADCTTPFMDLRSQKCIDTSSQNFTWPFTYQKKFYLDILSEAYPYPNIWHFYHPDQILITYSLLILSQFILHINLLFPTQNSAHVYIQWKSTCPYIESRTLTAEPTCKCMWTSNLVVHFNDD